MIALSCLHVNPSSFQGREEQRAVMEDISWHLHWCASSGGCPVRRVRTSGQTEDEDFDGGIESVLQVLIHNHHHIPYHTLHITL